MTAIAAYLHTGRHHRRGTWSDRSATVAAWLLDAAVVVRSAMTIAAVSVAAASLLLLVLPWRV